MMSMIYSDYHDVNVWQ